MMVIIYCNERYHLKHSRGQLVADARYQTESSSLVQHHFLTLIHVQGQCFGQTGYASSCLSLLFFDVAVEWWGEDVGYLIVPSRTLATMLRLKPFALTLYQSAMWKKLHIRVIARHILCVCASVCVCVYTQINMKMKWQCFRPFVALWRLNWAGDSLG